MSKLSVTIMAHKKRRKFVEELKPQLDGAGAVWDRKEDRWDTGRRALLAFDPKAKWHLVVQDDAILCTKFLPGVRKALSSVPLEVPVSFYTGKARPYTKHISQAVAGAKVHGFTWFEMRGPLWGPALAIPTSMIEELVNDCDEVPIPNYDMRMADWFASKGLGCWYSVPSLVNHRVGDGNPSLVSDRGAHEGRVAFDFIGEEDPTKIHWTEYAYVPGDPSQPWDENLVCMRCQYRSEDLRGAIVHSAERHGLGKIDFLASTPYHARTLMSTWRELPPEVRGQFFVVGPFRVAGDHVRLLRKNAQRKLSRRDLFTVVGAARDLRYLGRTPGWSLVGGESN